MERLLQKKTTTGVSPANMGASLRRARIDATFLSAEETPGPVASPAVPYARPALCASTPRATPPGADPRLRLAKGARRRPVSSGVTLADLIAADVIRPPVDLVSTYRDVAVRARVEANGSIMVDGQRTDSPSSAANIARETVLKAQGDPRSVQTNGWVFWSFVDGAGHTRTLASARDSYMAARGDGSRAPVRERMDGGSRLT